MTKNKSKVGEKIDVSRLIYLWELKDFNGLQKQVKEWVEEARIAGRTEAKQELRYELENILENL